jgi:meiotically up-regulated gene 157 (Mug157) protein
VHLLLEAHANITDLMYPDSEEAYKDKIKLAAQGHLSWVFTQAERPRGFWHRSYLANGKPKDQSIFQLDQQCYPLLELCEYLTHFPEDEEFVKSIVETGVIQELLRMLNAKQDKQTMLWPTDETPGDDRAEFPHHFSSHVLLWRTFTRLHELFARLEMPLDEQISQLDVAAAQLKKRTTEAFKATPPDSDIPLFAYLTNGCGRYTFYHDGNDVPTLFAKDWGFVSSREDICTWKATMDFALSPANEEGYCKGIPYGGLGSVHSPGAWTLGYFQEMAYAASNNNTPAVQGAWTKIAAAMLWDGTFPEAVDPTTAACTSKAWFSWPGAMIGALLIRMRKNGQEETLLQMEGI